MEHCTHNENKYTTGSLNDQHDHHEIQCIYAFNDYTLTLVKR